MISHSDWHIHYVPAGYIYQWQLCHFGTWRFRCCLYIYNKLKWMTGVLTVVNELFLMWSDLDGVCRTSDLDGYDWTQGVTRAQWKIFWHWSWKESEKKMHLIWSIILTIRHGINTFECIWNTNTFNLSYTNTFI